MRIVLTISALLFFLLLHVDAIFAASVSEPTSVPAEIQIGQSFTFNSVLSNVQAGEVYFIKCRLGPSSSSLTEGQTYNSTTSTWLNDNGAWVDMPTVQVDSSTFNFSVQCKVKPGTTTGTKIVFTRACLKQADGSCGTSFQSSSGTSFTALAEPTPTPTPTLAPTSTPTNTPTPIKTPTPTPTKTSSQTTNPTATPTPTPIKSGPTSAPTAMKTPTKASSPTPKIEEASVLSENVTVEPTKEEPTPTPPTLTAGFFQQNLPKIFIIGGGLFLLGAGVLFYKTQMKGDFDETDSDN